MGRVTDQGRFNSAIYYEDQSTWSAIDYQGLWRRFGRIMQSIPTPLQERDDFLAIAAARGRSGRLTAEIRLKRLGKWDDELAALDLDRMSTESRYLLKHMLIHTNRFENALQRFPNLRPLCDVGPLGHLLILSDDPGFYYDYYTDHDIIL